VNRTNGWRAHHKRGRGFNISREEEDCPSLKKIRESHGKDLERTRAEKFTARAEGNTLPCPWPPAAKFHTWMLVTYLTREGPKCDVIYCYLDNNVNLLT